VNRERFASLLGSPFHLTILLAAFASSGVVVWWRELRGASWLSSPEFSGYAGFFRAQAEAMAAGSFAVPDSALGDECYQVGSSCVGYFGITPSILRLPVVLVGLEGDLTPLFVSVGYLLAVAMSLCLLGVLWLMLVSRRERRTLKSRVLFGSLAVLGGPGSLALMAAEKDVADEAVLWGVGFMLATLVAVTLYIRDGRHLWLWLASVAACLAVGSRPSFVFSTIAVGIVIGVWQVARKQTLKSQISSFVLIVAPPITLAGTYLLKFGTIFPDQNMNRFIATSPAWRSILDANGGRFFGLDFIPTHVWDFFRPDALQYKLDYPRGIFFTQSTVLWPVESSEIYREPAASLTNLVPVGILLALVSLVALTASAYIRNIPNLRILTAVGLASGAGLFATWGHVAMTNRYLVDAWPVTVMLSFLGGSLLARQLPASSRWTALVTLLVVGLTAIGSVTVLVVMR